MPVRLLYPCDPFERKKPDEAYVEEHGAALAQGMSCSLFSAEDFEDGQFKPRPPLQEDETVIYRGWMMRPDRYAALQATIEGEGAKVLTTAAQYRSCHYLPEWYPLCESLTPKTVFLQKDSDFANSLKDLGWTAFFVKDYVKSLTTARGSVARTVEEIPEILELIEKFRGQIEGGVCIREYEDLVPESEERYFVYKRRAYARSGGCPQLVDAIAARIDSPFFSVDAVQATSGDLRLIELGDGQVSDRKKWPADVFVRMLQN
jgi:hypothetical protein